LSYGAQARTRINPTISRWTDAAPPCSRGELTASRNTGALTAGRRGAMPSHPQTQPPRGTFDAEGASKTLQPYVIDTRGLTRTFKKAEIALDTLTIVLGGEPQTRVTPPDWRHVAFVPNREQWAEYSGDYQSSQPLRIYREGDKLLGDGSILFLFHGQPLGVKK